MSQSRLPDRNLSRSAAEKVKGDVGVVCGARKPLGTPARRGGEQAVVSVVPLRLPAAAVVYERGAMRCAVGDGEDVE